MPTLAEIRRRARVALIVRARKRDGDGDGFIDDGKPTMRPAPRKVAVSGLAGYRKRLREMSDADLEASLRLLDSGKVRFADPAEAKAARRAVTTEMARRARQARKEREQSARYEQIRREQPHLDELEAWALATGQDPEKLRRQNERRGRPSLAQLRRDWEQIADAEYEQAEAATNGQMVRAEGRLRINPRDFWRRNAAYVSRWASDEFKQWAAEHGLTTFAAYRAMVEGRGVADARARDRGRLGEWA